MRGAAEALPQHVIGDLAWYALQVERVLKRKPLTVDGVRSARLAERPSRAPSPERDAGLGRSEG